MKHEKLQILSNQDRIEAIKKIIYEQKGMMLFNAQLSTAQSLLNKKIVELPTGEGKTLAAVVAAICYALEGHKVHILVFNDYLARRDYTNNRSIYEAFGLTVNFVDQYTSNKQQKRAYDSNILYVSAKQAGFDYLRDFIAFHPDDVVFPSFDVAIVDEADSIMIDEGATPLVLAGQRPEMNDVSIDADICIRQLTTEEYGMSIVDHQTWLTEKGIERIEKYLCINMYDVENYAMLSAINNALDAHYLLCRDKDYVVKDGVILLVEPTTGRIIQNKRYSEMLHRAVETKEGLKLSPPTMVHNIMPMQCFLNMYPILCGMTGTASKSANEFKSVYGLEVDVIPPNVPSIRTDHPDLYFFDYDDLLQALITQIKYCFSKQQPVLVGTKNVAESEQISELLTKLNIPHNVLNAKNDEKESLLIEKAGNAGQVTVSTNMAGRGVDIRLDNKAKKAGGLYVMGVGVNQSIRIDDQLRGRAGRQGDPGESKFFVWLNADEIACRMSTFERTRIELGRDDKRFNAVRRVQRKMEGEAAEARYTTIQFGSVLDTLRKHITELRMNILENKVKLECIKSANHEKYAQLLNLMGDDAINRTEASLALHYINKHWTQCLEMLESVRSGIHFTALRQAMLPGLSQGGPLDEYARIVLSMHDQIEIQVRQDIVAKMETLTGTCDDITDILLKPGTVTWTYAVDENAYQFSALAHRAKIISNKLTGEKGILTKLYRWMYGKKGGLNGVACRKTN